MLADLSSVNASAVSVAFAPVTPNAVSISAGLSKRPASAGWARGGFGGLVVVVVVAVDDEAGPPLLFPPQPATKIPIAATATAAVSWRMVHCPS